MPNRKRDNPPQQILSHLVPQLGAPDRDLQLIIENKHCHYFSFPISKSDGTSRIITPPKWKLKNIQKCIKIYLDSHIHWSPYVHGGIHKRSPMTNAIVHVGKKMVANLDVKQFFPSVIQEMVLTALIRIGCAPKTAVLLADLTTYQGCLPQGAPTSTLLANLVFVPIDDRFQNFCRTRRFTYTRYVDDITISGNCDLRPFQGIFVKFIEDGGFSVAENKVFFRGRHERQIVTGLLVNDKLRPTPLFTRELRHDLRNCWPGAAEPHLVAAAHHCFPRELYRKLWGRINFVRSIDNKLGRELRGLMAKIRWPSRKSV
jgi:RNA-directed DNA polymerase